MGSKTAISWCDATFNPWRGCTKVSPGCAHCYAETMSVRNPKVLGVWGDKGTRVIASESYWRQPLKWDREAAKAGERRRVFCASLADVFELPPGPSFGAVQEARKRLFGCFESGEPGLIEATPNLDWLLLTKRPENVMRVLNQLGIPGWFEWIADSSKNVWLGVSVEDRKRTDRIDVLRQTPAAVRFLSLEPLLEDLDTLDLSGISWVIVGGESGPGARPFDLAWGRSLVRQCADAGVACFVKQLGSKPFEMRQDPTYACEHEEEWFLHLRDKKGGEPSEWPADLRVRQLPEVRR